MADAIALSPSSTDQMAADLAESMRRHLFYSQAKSPSLATSYDHYMALSLAVRDRLLQNWVDTAETYTQRQVRTASYLSAEYLLGPHLENNLVNLGLRQAASQACGLLGVELDALISQEPEPGLGNGGLGRLAACFQESLASLELPAIGYGIRYEFGIFRQQITKEGQVESTDPWLARGPPRDSPGTIPGQSRDNPGTIPGQMEPRGLQNLTFSSLGKINWKSIANIDFDRFVAEKC